MNEQLSIFSLRSDDGSLSLQESRSDAKRKAIQRYLNNGKGEPTACINTYSPGGRKAKYYRLSYELNGKKKHIHIRGGNTRAKLANHRAKALLSMIDRGAELEELIAAINDFNSGTK